MLAEAYPDVCKSVDDMFFQELIAHEHLKTARRQKWDDIAKLCDKSLGDQENSLKNTCVA